MKHGCAKRSGRESLYGVWLGIKARCLYPNATGYKYYGGRGIGICEEWKNSYESFRAWALSNGYDPNAPYGKCIIALKIVNGQIKQSKQITQEEIILLLFKVKH